MRLTRPIVAALVLAACFVGGCADPLAVPGPPPPATCGNDVVEWPETCDGTDLNGESCRSRGYVGGFLACNPSCVSFDEGQCVAAACGNDRIESDELCDGFDLGGASCRSLGFDDGTLGCVGCAAYDTSACTVGTCGNGLHEPPEVCDGPQLGGESCRSLGFGGGTLACLSTCGGFDTSVCEETGCGNGVRDAGELCDGADLGGRTCASLGYAGGTLACLPSCDELDTSACAPWPTCGNGLLDSNELCDGMELGGVTCESLGFTGGTLACAVDCVDWDVSACLGGGELCHNLNDDDVDDLIDCEDPSACQHVSPVCEPGPTPPGGPCWAHSDCFADDSDPICFDELQTGIAGGYCSEFCDLASGLCGPGGTCIPSSLPSGTGLCFALCNGPEDCPAGQDCLFIGGQSACLPHCTADDQCSVYPYCNVDTGICTELDETCRDGFDNDDDGAVDCDDLDCTGDPSCGGTCVIDTDIGATTGPAAALGDTSSGVRNRYQPSCATSSAPDASLAWTAPATGGWAFDLVGTAFDAVLEVRDGDCGRVLACSADAELPGNPLRVDLIAGQRISIFVDGEVTASGPWILNITRGETGQCDDGSDNDGDGLVDCLDPDCFADPACGGGGCPDRVLPPVLGAPVTTGTTVGQGDDVTPSCGNSFAPDVQIAWTAPISGRFVVDTFGSGYDTVLDVLDGCGGASLACNDDAVSLQSEVIVDLVAGQSVILVVDGWTDRSGSFVLNIRTDTGIEVCDDGIDNDGDGAVDCNDPDCGGVPSCVACPELFLGPALGSPVLTGTTTNGDDQVAPSCSAPGSPEARIEWFAPWPGTFVFDTRGSSFDTALYLLLGDCMGPELACNDDAPGEPQVSELVVNLAGGEMITVVVDGWAGRSGDWVLNIEASEAGRCSDGIDNDNDGLLDCDDPECAPEPECLPSDCPDEDLGTVAAAVATGTTVGLQDELQPWCAVSTAPDVQYRWTAPTDGRYIFDTFGSDFDTILYALHDTCSGARVSCNDDSQGLQSRIRANLRAGETVILVVDGFGSSAGNYVLNVARQ